MTLASRAALTLGALNPNLHGAPSLPCSEPCSSCNLSVLSCSPLAPSLARRPARGPKYARSKLANVAFTAELQRRLQGRGITAYSTSPGLVNSSLFSSFPFYVQWAIRPVAPLFFRTTEQVGIDVPE